MQSIQGSSSGSPVVLGDSPSGLSTAESMYQKARLLYKTAIVAKEGFELASREGGNIICATATLGVGLSNLAAGNLIFGIPLTYFGATKLAGIFNKEDSRNEITRLLNDAQAANEMIETIGKANKESLAVVEGQANIIGDNLKDIKSRLTTIKNLATDGLPQEDQKEIQREQRQAKKLCHTAKQKLRQAERAFIASQEDIQAAQQIMNEKVLVGFTQLSQLVQKEGDPAALLSEFVSLTEEIEADCKVAAERMNRGNAKAAEGLQLLKEGLAQQQKATAASARVDTLVEEKHKNHLERIKNQATADKQIQKCENSLSVIKGRLSTIKQRMAYQDHFIHIAANRIEEAKNAADARFGMTSIMYGAVPVAAGIGAGLLGPITLIPALAVGVMTGHNRRQIWDMGAKAYNYVNGIQPDPVTLTNVSDQVSYNWNKQSTSLWGRCCGRESRTEGELHIQISLNETFTCGFNLNNPKDPISIASLTTLRDKLHRALKGNEITPEECERIMNQIENLEVPRYDDQKPQRLVTTSIPSFDLLRMDCQQLKEVRDLCKGLEADLISHKISAQDCLEEIKNLGNSHEEGIIDSFQIFLRDLKKLCESEITNQALEQNIDFESGDALMKQSLDQSLTGSNMFQSLRASSFFGI